jgi:hypothetical protein
MKIGFGSAIIMLPEIENKFIYFLIISGFWLVN